VKLCVPVEQKQLQCIRFAPAAPWGGDPLAPQPPLAPVAPHQTMTRPRRWVSRALVVLTLLAGGFAPNLRPHLARAQTLYVQRRPEPRVVAGAASHWSTDTSSALHGQPVLAAGAPPSTAVGDESEREGGGTYTTTCEPPTAAAAA